MNGPLRQLRAVHLALEKLADVCWARGPHPGDGQASYLAPGEGFTDLRSGRRVIHPAGMPLVDLRAHLTLMRRDDLRNQLYQKALRRGLAAAGAGAAWRGIQGLGGPLLPQAAQAQRAVRVAHRRYLSALRMLATLQGR